MVVRGDVGQVSESISKSGQLPIQHSYDLHLSLVEYDIIQFEVTVNYRRLSVLLTLRDILREPFDKVVHLFDLLSLCSSVLHRPSFNLSFIVVLARLGIVCKTNLLVVVFVEHGEDSHHFSVGLLALVRPNLGQVDISEDPTIHELHQVECSANDAHILTKENLLGNWESLSVQLLLNFVLSLNGMSSLQQLTWWLLPQDAFNALVANQVGGIGLSIVDLHD